MNAVTAFRTAIAIGATTGSFALSASTPRLANGVLVCGCALERMFERFELVRNGYYEFENNRERDLKSVLLLRPLAAAAISATCASSLGSIDVLQATSRRSWR